MSLFSCFARLLTALCAVSACCPFACCLFAVSIEHTVFSLKRSASIMNSFALLALCCATLAALVAGNAAGPNSCDYPTVSMSLGKAGTGNFVIDIFELNTNTPATNWTINKQYTVKLRNTAVNYKGFLLQSVLGSNTTAVPNVASKCTQNSSCWLLYLVRVFDAGHSHTVCFAMPALLFSCSGRHIHRPEHHVRHCALLHTPHFRHWPYIVTCQQSAQYRYVCVSRPQLAVHHVISERQTRS